MVKSIEHEVISGTLLPWSHVFSHFLVHAFTANKNGISKWQPVKQHIKSAICDNCLNRCIHAFSVNICSVVSSYSVYIYKSKLQRHVAITNVILYSKMSHTYIAGTFLFVLVWSSTMSFQMLRSSSRTAAALMSRDMA